MSMEPTSRPRVPLVPGPDRKLPEPERLNIAPRVMLGPIGNIAKAVAGVMTKVGTIPKNGHNKFHNYHYVRMEDLLHATTPLMGEHGLMLLQNEIEIQRVETRVNVLYEFTLAHESGETFVFHQSGMAAARDSKGNWDDKAINKCHTAARKYALSALFQVPSGDFDDADEGGDANQPAEQRRVPGPKATPDAGPKKPAPTQLSQEGGPQKIVMPQGTTADQWAAAYIQNIGKAMTKEQIAQWESLNDDFLQRINDRYPEIYAMLGSAVQRRLSDIGGTPAGMPSPKADPQEAMNWIAGQLQNIKTYETAEAFWNEIVAPREAEFELVDWEMLMQEWHRTEQRFAPPKEGGE
jgi:hypothetical protein